MNKNVNPLLALAIILVFGGLLALYTLFYGKAVGVPKVQYLKVSPNKTVFIRLGNQLFEHSSEGDQINSFDLKQLGINSGLGDFDFFQNGEILINRDDYLPTLKEKLDNYQRKANTDTQAPASGKGLQRCDLSTYQCHPFNQNIPAIKGAHYIYIDRSTDDAYLADTSRHQIRKFNNQGDVLAELKTGLQFPNQVYLNHGTLYVLDTNHHSIKLVDASNANFGQIIEEYEVTHTQPWVWPSAFQRVNNEWWVHFSNNDMENAKIVRFDNQWKKLSLIDLPKNADPVSSIYIDNKIITADANNYSLYQFDTSGNQLVDFAISEIQGGLNSTLKENKSLDGRYRFWSRFSLWFGIGLFIPLFIFAISKAIKDSKQEQIERDKRAKEISENEEQQFPIMGEWIETKPIIKKMHWLFMAMGVLSLISFFMLFSLFQQKEKEIPLELYAIFAFLIVLMPLIYLPIKKVSQYKIGFFKKHLIVQNHDGKQLSVNYDDIKWNDRAFVVQDWFVPIGNAAKSFFPYEKLEERLFPRLSEQKRFGELEALKLQWGSPDGVLKYSSLAVVLAIFLIILLKRNEILSFLEGLGLI